MLRRRSLNRSGVARRDLHRARGSSAMNLITGELEGLHDAMDELGQSGVFDFYYDQLGDAINDGDVSGTIHLLERLIDTIVKNVESEANDALKYLSKEISRKMD